MCHLAAILVLGKEGYYLLWSDLVTELPNDHIHIIIQKQKQWEEGRTERMLYNNQRNVGKGRITRRNIKEEYIIYISLLRFEHTALNSTLNKIRHQTGKCDQEETVEHVIMKCPMFSERRILVCNLKRIKMKFDLLRVANELI